MNNVADNPKAGFEYEFQEYFEAGIELLGQDLPAPHYHWQRII
jgi:tmRNA-binding protein